jgi:DNA primase small subunit
MEEDFAMAAESDSDEEADIVMAEAGQVQGVVEDIKPAAEPLAAQAVEDEDMGVEIKQETKPEIKQETRPEIKLEDLFAGMDSDDEEFITSVDSINAQEM